jgi:predicted TIM-barrel fold metal-dependent hydrolase
VAAPHPLVVVSAAPIIDAPVSMSSQHRIPFVDAHVHLWDLRRIRYPWLAPPFSIDGPNGDVSPIAHNYSLEDYRTDAQSWNVVGMVHVDAGAHPNDAALETTWLEAMAENQGLPSGIVAFAPLDSPSVERLLALHALGRRVRGVRQILNWHVNPQLTYMPRDLTLDPAWQRGFGLLARYGLSFDLQAYPNQFAALAELVRRHPQTPVIINHTGMAVDRDAEGIARWRNGLRSLAALPNVFIKISGVGFVFKPWSLAQVRDYVREAIEIFGPYRVMFGSNFPTDKLFGSFDRTFNAYSEIVADFSVDERRDMFGCNADRIYRLGLAERLL